MTGGRKAVSYTHLDVYKRQILRGINRLRNRGVFIYGNIFHAYYVICKPGESDDKYFRILCKGK